MKPNKMKLQLKKHAVSNLSNAELSRAKGGVQEVRTTSIGHCTGFLCCEPPATATCTCNPACYTTIYPTFTE